MNDTEYEHRAAIVSACRRMGALGINQGTSGNISCRWKQGLLITPSGLDYDAMTPDDIVFMDMTGRHKADQTPSSEWHFHRDILRARAEVNAVVHAHPVYCTALAIAHREIPAVHYMIAAAGGPSIRCAPYATYGTEELSRHALAALERRLACLLANHGLIACGPNLNKALWLAAEVETLARQYIAALQVGETHILPDDEIARVVEKFKNYGPRQQPGGIQAKTKAKSKPKAQSKPKAKSKAK
jgi:L-fuculose-phosphate aldolase